MSWYALASSCYLFLFYFILFISFLFIFIISLFLFYFIYFFYIWCKARPAREVHALILTVPQWTRETIGETSPFYFHQISLTGLSFTLSLLVFFLIKFLLFAFLLYFFYYCFFSFIYFLILFLFSFLFLLFLSFGLLLCLFIIVSFLFHSFLVFWRINEVTGLNRKASVGWEVTCHCFSFRSTSKTRTTAEKEELEGSEGCVSFSSPNAVIDDERE